MNKIYLFRLYSYFFPVLLLFSLVPLHSTQATPFASAPTALNAQPSLVGAITVQWNAVSGATRYVVERSLHASVGFEQLATVPVTAGKTLYTFRDAGLGYGETYHYRVKAVDASGDSPWSTIVSATTHAHNKTYNIMPLGDSNTHGTKSGDTRPDTERIAYRAQLHKLLSGINARFTYVGSERSGSDSIPNDHNAGFPAARTNDILDLLRTSSYRNQNNEVVSRGTGTYLDKFNPDVILLHLGTNGGLTGVSDDDRTIGEMASILDEVDAYEARAGKEVTVVLALIVNRLNQAGDEAARAITTRFNQKVKAMAENRIRTRSDRVVLVDMEREAGLVYEFWWGPLEGDMDDLVHPYVTGFQKMANQWFRALNPLLRPSTVAGTAPETTIGQKPNAVSNSREATFTFSSNKSPVLFEVSLNGADYAFATSPYTLNNLADGSYTLSVRAVDAAGRRDATPATHTWAISTEPPTPPTFTAVTEDRGPVNNDRITSDNTIRLSGKAQSGVDVTVSEASRGVLGSVKANSSGDWVYNYEGTTLPAGVYRFTATATDVVGNVSKESNTFTVTIELTRPDVEVSTQATAPVREAFEVKFTFTEEVYGLAKEDITVTGATLGNLTAVDKSVYTATITPAANTQGAVSISLAANKATDLAGNGNNASNKLDLAYDLKRPTVALSSTAAQLVKEPFSVTFTFSEAVAGFAVADISVNNGTAGGFTAVSATEYRATITPGSDGEVRVSVAANRANDQAGNGNEASAELKRLYDIAPPAVSLSTEAPGLTNKPFSVTVQFNEPVSALQLSAFTTNGARLSSLRKINDSRYTVLLTPERDGEVSLQLPAEKVQDQAGNGNTASNLLQRTFDSTAPGVAISTEAPELTNQPFTVTFKFSEAVEGFAVAGITVGNGSASDFRQVSADTYSAAIRPAADGAVTVQVAAAKARDKATNPNMASNTLRRTYDGTAPKGYTVAFGTDKVDYQNQQAVSFGVQGAEAGATYFYTISSDKGDAEATGSATTTSASFTIPALDLSALYDGVLTVRFYQVDAAGNRGETATAQVQKMTKNISDVSGLATIRVPFGTGFTALPLPADVAVRYTSGETDRLAINWQAGNYDGLQSGNYTLRGELVLLPGTSNLDNRMATVVVTVAPNQPPTAIALSAQQFKPNAAPAEVIATLSTTDPDDESHTYALVSGLGDTHNSYFELRDGKLYLKANTGLTGIRDFLIRVRTTDPYQNAYEQPFVLRKEVYQPAEPIKLVNAFSPDNDGINDTWTIPELRYYDEVSIQVFDRAGVRLFHSTNPEQGWDGRGRDGQIRQGSYFYVIEVKDTGLVQKGVLTVLK